MGLLGLAIAIAVAVFALRDPAPTSPVSERPRDRQGTTTPAPTTTTTIALPTPVTAPPFPDEIPGYVREGEPVSLTTRIFSGQPNFIPDYPATMSGCDLARITTRWRSLAGPVTAGRTDPQHVGLPLPSSPAEIMEPNTNEAGLIVGHSCEEPVFFAPDGTFADVAIEYQLWYPAA